MTVDILNLQQNQNQGPAGPPASAGWGEWRLSALRSDKTLIISRERQPDGGTSGPGGPGGPAGPAGLG